MVNPDNLVTYTCEIKQGQSAPKVKIYDGMDWLNGLSSFMNNFETDFFFPNLLVSHINRKPKKKVLYHTRRPTR